ncbi:hypothetical protein AN239_12645, partial [Neisseria gonorrhoeae]
PLNLASRDTVGGRRAANGGIRQTARSRARRIAGCKAPFARLPKGDVRKGNTPLWPDAMYRVTALFYPCALIHGTAVFGNPQPPPWPAIAACAAMAGRGGGILQVAATFPNNSTA